MHHDFCRYLPHPEGWMLLVLGDDGRTVLQRLPLTEWLCCSGLHERLDVYLRAMIPVADHRAHCGGRYLAESPTGVRTSLDTAQHVAKHTLEETWEA